MPDEERIEKLELENKVLQQNNKGLKAKIDEQQKEIEELKEKTKKCEYYEMVADELYKNSVSKDKIKAKIEPKLKELDKNMKKEWQEYGNSREFQDMEDEWNFLQSLLEEYEYNDIFKLEDYINNTEKIKNYIKEEI